MPTSTLTRRRFVSSPSASVLALALAVRLLQPRAPAAEGHVDYKYEDYNEDRGRIHIITHSYLLELPLTSWLTLKGAGVYDGISGATPNGLPPQTPGDPTVPVVKIDDERRAGYVEPTLRFGANTFTPQLAYSIEGDYESYGLSFTYAREFNDKNTTLTLGVGHNSDRIISGPGMLIFKDESKDSTDYLVGVSQLLGPKTVFSANLTIGYSHGFQADPYKGAAFPAYFIGSRFPERRPQNRFKQIALLGLTHYLDALDASIETSYRYFHDSYRIHSHTVSATWNQKVGKRLVVSPMFRFYNQSEASFYGVMFDGDPTDPSNLPPSRYYSADFRLSSFNTLTYGVKLMFRVDDHITVDLAARRYDMNGLDGITSPLAYANANIFTIGLRIWF